MFNVSIIPETPQILGRLGSLFRRKLSADATFDASDSPQPSVVLETQAQGAVIESQPVLQTQDVDTTLDSSGDVSSLLLTQLPEQQTVEPPSLNSGATIPTLVSCRESAPFDCALADLSQVQLFRGPREPLSAFYLHPLRWRNRNFISAEQAYQYAKLVHHKVTLTRQKEMLRCKTSHACKQLAFKCVQTSNASWDLQKFELMEEICIAKSRQCRKFKEALRRSGDAHLLHNTETDSVWGCGFNLKGQNKMGHILMNVRRRDAEYTQDFPPLPQVPVETAHPQVTTRTVVPATNPRKIIALGNSNSRGLSRRFCQGGISSTGYVYPGQTADQIARRVESIDLPAQTPSTILLHVGDVEVRDFARPVASITRSFRTMIDTVRTKSADVPIIISGLPHVPGQRHLSQRIENVNSANSRLCRSMNNVYFVSNKTAALERDQIHLTAHARDLLCRNISYLVRQCI